MSFHDDAHDNSPRPFVPQDFEVPTMLETERFVLRMLTINDLVRDYEAVMTTIEHLNERFGPGWPEGLTLEQNLIDLGWHQKEFQRRSSFAYTVVAPDESCVLGCVYIYPTLHPDHDAEIYWWARQSELASGLETELESALKQWMGAEWPFTSPALPGADAQGSVNTPRAGDAGNSRSVDRPPTR